MAAAGTAVGAGRVTEGSAVPALFAVGGLCAIAPHGGAAHRSSLIAAHAALRHSTPMLKLDFWSWRRGGGASAPAVVVRPLEPVQPVRQRAETSLRPPTRQVQPRFKTTSVRSDPIRFTGPRLKYSRPEPVIDSELVARLLPMVPDIVKGRRQQQMAAIAAASWYGFAAWQGGPEAGMAAAMRHFEELRLELGAQADMGDYDVQPEPVMRDYRIPVIDEWTPVFDRDTWDG